jgi:molecular chaperone GrpE
MTNVTSETTDTSTEESGVASAGAHHESAPAALSPGAATTDVSARAPEPKPEPTLEDLLHDAHPVVRKALEAERERAKQAEDRMLRVLAETDNQKKRLAREHEDRIRFANESLLLGMLPVLDNLELSLSHARDDVNVKQLRKGVELTLTLFRQVIKDTGVQPIAAERGSTFDPALHEAVAQDDHADLPERTIATVVQSGFKYRDRVLRPARVTVATGKGLQKSAGPDVEAELSAQPSHEAAKAASGG